MEITAKPFEALDAAKQADGLIPAIIQDARTLRVLMLGYMNREAYEKSLSEGRVTFYSRTRRRLWTKGETSGNFLRSFPESRGSSPASGRLTKPTRSFLSFFLVASAYRVSAISNPCGRVFHLVAR